ncbi:MAG TPA: hypothetical protein VFL59_02335 [Candidatus Nanopelagicales bacterium]|nr:hypothetical protein [Candidatus Nanopelagicales bacterium]
MVQYVGIDADEARQRLASIGTELVPPDGDEDEYAVVARVLAENERAVRVEVEIEPPADPDTGMGAWHVNAETEAHTVQSGTGVVEFWTPSGPVAAVLRSGVVMVVRGGEHRYRPLTAQRWAIRHSGDADADLGTRATGRESGPWPEIP